MATDNFSNAIKIILIFLAGACFGYIFIPEPISTSVHIDFAVDDNHLSEQLEQLHCCVSKYQNYRDISIYCAESKNSQHISSTYY